MEKTPDTIIDELHDTFDDKVSSVPETDNTSTRSMAESVKKHKHHDKSKKHKRLKKKSKKSKKRKHHSSRSSSPDDRIELKLKKDKLEEAKSGMPVTLDVVMETIVNTANEKSEEVHDGECNKNENSRKKESLTDESEGYTPEKEFCATGLNNGKIVIKDLKESRLYHELINEIEEKERLKAEKYEDGELSCSSIDLDKKRKKEKPKSKKKKRSRSRNRSNTPKRHKKRKRSHSPNSRDKHSRYDSLKSRKTNSRNQNGSNSKSRHKDTSSRSKDKSRHLKRSITPDKGSKCSRRSRLRESTKPKRSADHDKTKKKSRSRENSNNRTRHRSPSCEKIDKKKLFKIARKNALSLVQQGVLPVGSVKKDTVAAANLPTKTVDELTDFCRKLSKKEKDHDDDTSISSDDEEFKQPFHHPFLVKDRPNIVMNIRNATQLPTKSFQEKTIGQDILRQQFPVSSGQTHSLALNEWVPLGPEESAKLNKISRPDDGNKFSIKSQTTSKIVSVEPIVKPVSSSISAVVPVDFKHTSPIHESSAPANPYAHGSYSLLSYETGQFTGHTGAKILTPAELSAGYQPWVKKDHLKNTAPVNSGIGIHLLQKMGWKPGEGLGKNQSGSLEPLLLDVKMDKRGLVTEEELVQGNRPKKFPKKVAPPMLSLDGKHPVSLLNEFCAKRKWDVPKFNTLDESGPSHRKTFIMTVIVNGVQYCSSRCQTKKLAKLEAAKTCLREIGLLK